MRRSSRVIELVVVVALVGGGAWLRWCHLGTPSLWWDELVEIRTADRATVAEVWRAARDGVAPGSANAGAVPLDYLALHAWLRVAPAPSVDGLERHHRIPSFVWSVATLPAIWWLARMLGGPAAGTAALALAAGAMPMILYAAEARFYSLWMLGAVANLIAFAGLVRAPSARRIAVYTVVTVAYVLSGLYGVVPVAAEYLLLGAVAAQSAGRERRLLAGFVASGLVVAGVVAAWVGPAALTASFGRPTRDAPPLLPPLRDAMLFFADGRPMLAAALAAALVVAPVVVRRDRAACATTAVGVLAAAMVPLMGLVAQWKRYYFHPRHALFLLPMVQLAAALVLGRAATRVARGGAAVVVAALVGVASAVPVVPHYVAAPARFFDYTKTHRDYRALARLLVARTADAPADGRYVLVLEQRRAGHLANPTVAFYLEAYGLADRVLLAGTPDPLPLLRRLPRACPTSCRGPTRPGLYQTLFLNPDPFDQPTLMRAFMRIRPPSWGKTFTGIGVVLWAPGVPAMDPAGLVGARLDGLALFEVEQGR